VRVLVTGASGGLGQRVCRRLARDPAVELIRTGRTGADGPDYHACDLTDAAAVTALVARTTPDRILHLAGSSSGDYARDCAVNADAARFICEAVLGLGLRPRIVVIGSAAEYGLVTPDENPVSEARATRPASVYGLTKSFQTGLATLYAARHDIDIVTARLFNLLTPGLGEHLFVGRVERLIGRFRAGEIGSLEFGSLASTRDYVDGAEAVDQLQRIADHGLRGEVYHVASGRPVVMRDLLAGLLREADIDPAVVREVPERASGLGTDVPMIYADISRTRALAHA